MAWLKLAEMADLAPDYPTACNAGDHRIALYVVDGKVYATSNVCTHQFALLSDGYQENGEIECPLHQGRFDIATGKALCSPLTEDLETYEVRLENGEVWVRMEDGRS